MNKETKKCYSALQDLPTLLSTCHLDLSCAMLYAEFHDREHGFGVSLFSQTSPAEKKFTLGYLTCLVYLIIVLAQVYYKKTNLHVATLASVLYPSFDKNDIAAFIIIIDNICKCLNGHDADALKYHKSRKH